MILAHTPEFVLTTDSGKPQIVSSLKICGFPESVAIHQIPERNKLWCGTHTRM
jgi:hypothetical protein